MRCRVLTNEGVAPIAQSNVTYLDLRDNYKITETSQLVLSGGRAYDSISLPPHIKSIFGLRARRLDVANCRQLGR